ncbi:pneumococcal serine-rich repeat protein isoform X3 [Drosophila obscura]|uniref:pneumococcal serine-rich repeat protein isoform X3 n=1 Tax=Drosophila obscura TaxID=7282 RepID=UPI001BB28044|nr:pneumococcal serine-rich repeat protein isoform X3 [Drosophila obscura]
MHIMSTDNPTQLLTTRDLGQLRGHLQATTAPATAPSAVHGYRSVIPPPISTSATAPAPVAVVVSSTAAAAPVSTSSSVISATSSTTSSSNSSSIHHGGGNMQATSSKYVVIQPNHNGGFTAYDSSASAVATSPTVGGGGAATGGNIVLLAAEPLEMGSADALAAAAAAAAGADDGELRSLSWLSDSNLIKGIVTSSGPTTAASQAKRAAAVALKAPAAVCLVGDLIEELPASSNDMADAGEQQGTPGGVYSTTTVHKGPSGTTTVVEYKATKTTTTATRTSYMPVVVTSSNSSIITPVAQATISPAKQQQQQQQQTQQIYVTSNGTGSTTYNTSSPPSMATVSVSSALPCSPNNNSNHHNTTTHHPHKKYLREKMNVDHSNHVASTVTVVSSPASSNNSSLSSTSASAFASASSMSANGSSGGINGAGNSPGPKAASSYTTVYETVKFSGAGTTPCSSSSSSNNHSNSNSNRQHLPDHTTLITTTGLISASSLTGSYSFVNHLAGSTHVMASTAPTETTLGGGGSIYYTNATPMQQQQHLQQQQQQQQQQQRGMHVSVSPPPPPINATMGGHNGSGSGLNLRSPNSYSSYENEDSLKEFDMTVNSRMHTSTPQYVAAAAKSSSYNNNNANSSSNTTNGAGGGGGAGNTPQKQKHPNNVPYDPLVHTNNKPPYSFSSLIFMAIEGSNEKALPVKEIYAWIVQHFPYFKTAPNGWKNSVRHNLSLNKSFVKVEKAPNMGKGSLWRVEPQQRQNLIQALNRSPFFPNSAVDKISTSLKSPNGQGAALSSSGGYDGIDGVAAASTAVSTNGMGMGMGCGNSAAPVALVTPTKSNGLVLANGGASQSAAMPNSPLANAGGGGNASHARVDPKLFPYLSKAFSKIREDGGPPTQQLLLGEALDDEVSGEYAGNQNHNSVSGSGSGSGRYIYVGNGVAGAAASAAAPNASGDGINFERLARDCGADSMDDVHAAAAMLFLKHGPKAFTESFQNGAPVITSSPSEDHTYSAGGNSNADSGASTPLMNGNILAGQTPAQMQLQAQANAGAGSDSNCASSDAAYDSSEENHNITPEELADQQRHRDGVDALLSLSRSSIVECGSVATTHYHSNGSSGSSHGSPHKRPSSHSLEEEHEHHLLQQYQPLLSSTSQTVYTNGSGSKMALLSSAAANVALAQQQQQQHHQIHQMHQQQHHQIQQHQHQQHTDPFGSVSGSYLAGLNHCLPAATGAGGQAAMLPNILSAAMANAAVAAAAAAAAAKNKVKPVRGLRTKIKRKSAWMR